MADELVLRWRTDITQLERGLREVQERVKTTVDLFGRLGSGQQTESAFERSFATANTRVRDLLQNLERVQQLRDRLARSGGITTNIPRELTGVIGRTGAIGSKQLANVAGDISNEIRAITSGMKDLSILTNLDIPIKAFDELGASIRRAQRAALQAGDFDKFKQLFALGGRGGDILGTQAVERLQRFAQSGRASAEQLERLRQEAQTFGGTIGENLRKGIAEADALVGVITKLRAVLAAMQKGEPGQVGDLGILRKNKQFTVQDPELQALVGNYGPRAAFEEALGESQDELSTLSRQFGDMAQAGQEAGRKIASGFQEVPSILNTTAGISQRAEAILSGDAVNRAIAERVRLLETEKNATIEQIAALRQMAIASLGRRESIALSSRLVNLAKAEEDAERRVNRVLEARRAIEDQLLSSANARTREAFETARQQASRGQTPSFQGAELSQQDVNLLNEYVALSAQEIEFRRQLNQVQQEAVEPRNKLAAALDLTGVSPQIRELENNLDGVQKQLNTMASDDALGALRNVLGPEFTRAFAQLQRVRERLSEGGRRSPFSEVLGEERKQMALTAAETENLERAQATLVKQLEGMLASAGQQGLLGPVVGNLADQIASQLRPLERSMIETFSNMGNRFRATFQFALSGAIIYGLQNFAREAFKTAVEVERAFADIETALQVHRVDLSGWQLDLQVEGVRRDILAIANDFNVLPTEANKAGYQMVARFNDMGNAMKALRAQLLATKVSTIEQSEVLRALTATAETFAGAIFDGTSALSLTDRLLKRESIAANLYGDALDAATRVQQRFGIEVEDVLEGTARGSEVFRQSGFSMEETVAIVSAASLRLGQTGAQVAERFGRAFGGLTPEIIEELVTFADRTDNLSLQYSDFSDSVANGLFKIQDQISNLNTSELQQLINIVGQRRETDVVAAFFGSGDLQQSILGDLQDSAGAAEQRFQGLINTTSELFESVKVQFSELAQNLERLGALSPLRVFLQTLDSTLSIVNSITKAFKSMFDAINAIRLPFTDMGLGEFVIQITTLVASLGALGRVGQALGRLAPYFGALALGKLPGQIAGQGVLAGVAMQAAGQATAARAANALSAALVGAGKGLAGFAVFLAHPFRTIRELTQRFKAADDGIFAWLVNLRASTAEMLRQNIIRRLEDAKGAGGALLRKRFLTQTTGPDGAAVTALSRGALGATAAVAALAVATASVVGALRGAAEAQKAYAKELRKEEASATREIFAEDLEGVDAEVRRIQGQISATQTAMSSAVDGIGQWINGVLINFRRDLDATMRAQLNEPGRRELAIQFTEGLGLAQWRPDFGGELDEFLDPNSLRGMQVTLELRMRKQMQLLSDQFNESVAEAAKEFSPEQRRAARPFLQRGGLLDTATSELADLMALPQSEENLAAVEEKRQEIQGLWDSFWSKIASIAEEANAEFEGSLSSLEERLKAIQFDRDTGQITGAEQVNLLGNLLGDAQRLQAEVKNQPEFLAQAVEFAQGVQGDLRQAYEDGVDRELVALNSIKDTDARLRAKVAVLQGAVNTFRTLFGDNASELLAGWLEEIRAAQEELIDRARDKLLGDARHAVGISRNTDRKIEAMKALLGQLYAQNVQALIDGNTELAHELAQEIDRLLLDIATTQSGEARTSTVAGIRLSGPILSRMTSLKAEIAGITHDINSGFLSHAEIMEAQVRLNELFAQRVQEQARAVSAYLRIQAGTRNEMKLLQAELTILAKEMEIAAVQYGKNEAAYLEVALRHQQAKDAIIDAQLRLNDLNRRLATTVDVTNPFADAQLELMRIMEALAQEGLGELEKAQLELEKKKAEANALRQFYSDRLFQLQFDFETGAIGEDVYVNALKRLQETVDTSTRQGKEIWLEIEGLINGMAEDVGEFQFNIPAAIRLPTIFEVRRALAADQLGVNYMDNRQVNVNVDVSSEIDLQAVFDAIDDAFGEGTNYQFRRSATGGAAIYAGGF